MEAVPPKACKGSYVELKHDCFYFTHVLCYIVLLIIIIIIIFIIIIINSFKVDDKKNLQAVNLLQ